ncbi:MAG: hypothetical protein HY935_04350 [Nitrosomonadales bacterium]|nr:hypothetical protein [Nitrosomonadales bacterium]
MNFSIVKMLRCIPLVVALLLGACGGGGSSVTPVTSTYTVGGTVTGLNGSVVLQNNGADNLTVTANGNFTFAASTTSGNTYAVTVLTQPIGQTCSVSTGAGTVSGNNVSNVTVTCATSTYTVGGTVSGLTGTVVLQDNSGDNLSVSANGAFTFATPVANGSPYSVTVLTQPSVTMSCSVTNGTGTISLANVSNVAITCALNTYTVGGTVTGLNGSVVLQDNGIDNLTVSVNGPFNFPAAVASGNPYIVSVFSNPASQHCAVSSGAGTIASSNISNVGVACLNNQLGGAIQTGTPLNLTKAVSTLAGAAPGADGTGAGVRFNAPFASISDGTNLYVADTSNHTIRQIVIATGAVTTLAGTAGTQGSADGTGAAARFNTPYGITLAGGNLYVTDSGNSAIRQIVIATGAVTTLAGGVWGSADGTGTAASFNTPYGITTDNTNLYVTDNGSHTIRQIVIATGAVTTLAGTAGAPGSANGTGTAATFKNPAGITINNGTDLYVADYGNHTIRQIVISTGAVYTTAGTAGSRGSSDLIGQSARFNGPIGITVDNGSLYVADQWNHTIRLISIVGGQVNTIAGTTGVSGSADGTGTAASFTLPSGITSNNGSLYVADTYNHRIRKIVIASWAVTTLAGTASVAVDATGAAARLVYPNSITTDGSNLYVAETINNTIRQIVITTGAVTTLAGTAGTQGSTDGAGTGGTFLNPSATFDNPSGITTDGSNLYVADSNNNNTIRQIVIATGAVTTLAGTAGITGSADGTGAAAAFSNPTSTTTDGSNLYVTDTGNHTIRKIVISTGVVTTLSGTVGTPGSGDGTGTAATFNGPASITTDGINLFVADTGNHTIRQIVIATGAVTTLAGTAGTLGSADGTGTAASFSGPSGIITDGINLFVADTGNHTIRQIVIASGVVTTLAGTAGITGAADATGTAARFNNPFGITTDGSSLYVADRSNGTIRKIQ